ncbi:FAD-dependent oxidoreductase [Curvibacter sp. APW13]|uniref:FAD-dependent oxidoreductase n=1 Tax=Curvibacter sp. APW13 TaxID=3077236 RepID=UPI0028DECE3C|nr:FAD-dependent oxidoreductase [Curvibacter sp. APW13]MDT8992502.1 FAD-dependent oxidoreductase [Curvibacter sp. APW13]
MKVKHLQHALDTEGPLSGPGFQPHTLLLLGAGHAHVHVLAQLAKEPLVGVQVVLVAPYPRQLYSGMVPGMVAGHYAIDDCAIALAELVRRAGVRWLQASVTDFNADARMVRLDNGMELPFDWASLNTGPVQDREQIEAAMPGARTHALFLRPIEGFAALWPRVAAMGDERALRMAVIGGGAGGIELAMALQQRLPRSAVTLVSGDHPPGANYPESVQTRIARALKQRNITVLQENATGFLDGEVLLSNGARLACDVPLIAVGAHAPRWLQDSALALDAQGFVLVNAFQQSTSHPHVFAVGDVCRRGDRELPRSGVYAVRSGPALMRNLAALARNEPLHAHQPPARTLNLLSCGNRTAIASWGQWSAQGRWVWWWKDRIDRRFLARYSVEAPAPAR